MLATRELEKLNSEPVPDSGSTSGGAVFRYADQYRPIGLRRRSRVLLQMLASNA